LFLPFHKHNITEVECKFTPSFMARSPFPTLGKADSGIQRPVFLKAAPEDFLVFACPDV
jgi:hypothetical protein